MRFVRRLAPFAVISVLAVVFSLIFAHPAHADPTFDQRLFADTNADCFAHSWDDSLAALAQQRAEYIADSGSDANNLQPPAKDENDGWIDNTTDPVQAADGINQAYMNSPEHHANICDTRYHAVGIGSVFRSTWNCGPPDCSGTHQNVWISAVEFGDPSASAPPPAQPHAPSGGPHNSAPAPGGITVPGTGGADTPLTAEEQCR